ncbi:4-hydroxy-2-oxovalerate aldolase [Candidatus Daviesbacteria bacterium RIFCSPHIGHO2_12_FULL_37_16]|uniref:4-hydroxy-2-oxovalerate aldolase n=1 Tax=Candidatus Daviesbacteria bacterium RIFCSPHIGHO2_12_FULL_37_16 TaxID=1797778 RepID=A0A1F5K4R3_9BACT|nr:MAG: 4-hydroxy-2-oxovalerate aldolase [Candidatus Daviesbacteria bacterium RIFCSPHIGHO2_12_FULL_37_16]
MNDILIIDSTLRDGSHAIRHQFNAKTIRDYAKGAQKARIPLLVVGHGNGLGASSLQLGLSKLPDTTMLKIAKSQLKRTRLGAFLIPGFGTIKNDLAPAIKAGIDALMVASHCTEANITRQHIEYGVKEGLEVFGVLMMSHMLNGKELLLQAKLMQIYGARGVILMDSAGAYLPEDVYKKVKLLSGSLKIDVGFHAHNNLGMTIANSAAAVKAGAKIIDATSRGLGAGAGNCQLEVIVAVLLKMGYKLDLDVYQLMNNSEKIIAKIMKRPQEISSVSLTSGLAGVFSGFAPHVRGAAERFGVDARDILIELGRRKIVAGQEDIIVDVAANLAQKKKTRGQDNSIEALI